MNAKLTTDRSVDLVQNISQELLNHVYTCQVTFKFHSSGCVIFPMMKDMQKETPDPSHTRSYMHTSTSGKKTRQRSTKKGKQMHPPVATWTIKRVMWPLVAFSRYNLLTFLEVAITFDHTLALGFKQSFNKLIFELEISESATIMVIGSLPFLVSHVELDRFGFFNLF